MTLLELARALETLVVQDLNSGRANDGTTQLLAAANELRRRMESAQPTPGSK